MMVEWSTRLTGECILTLKIQKDYGQLTDTDSFFTLPVSFNQTFNSTNATTFSSGLAAAGLGSILDNPAGVTIFSTNNEAYQAGVGNASTSALTRILSNQIIPNFLGYTPLLPNGTVLTTQGGTKLTVTVKNGVWFVNGAKIIAADQITSNGVAHIVDSVSWLPYILCGFAGLLC
jgi:uncharacterized surface protein with fasciclin (FAS1) repeats